ncbi:MAG: hypothetical protein K2M49_06730 [Muribaculaceae bacterium]|nr:hypothetical protein [Muribaculaceae bacterium]
MKATDKEKRWTIPVGKYYAQLAIGVIPRILAYSENLKRQERPPKHSLSILALLVELSQRENWYNDTDTIKGVEISTRHIQLELKAQCQKTIVNALKWLSENDWINIERNGLSLNSSQTIFVNIQKVSAQFGEPAKTPPLTKRYRQLEDSGKEPTGKYNDLSQWTTILNSSE